MKTYNLRERVLIYMVAFLIYFMMYTKLVYLPIKNRASLCSRNINEYKIKITSEERGIPEISRLRDEYKNVMNEYERISLKFPGIEKNSEIIKHINDYSNDTGVRVTGINSQAPIEVNTMNDMQGISNKSNAHNIYKEHSIIAVPFVIYATSKKEEEMYIFISKLYNDVFYKKITSISLYKLNDNTTKLSESNIMENSKGNTQIDQEQCTGSIIVEGSGENLRILNENILKSDIELKVQLENYQVINNVSQEYSNIQCEIIVNYYFNNSIIND